MPIVSTNDVFRKIKDLSKRVPNPRPQIPVNDIASELQMSRDQIFPCIAELKKLRLIQCETATPSLVKLTLLGCTVNR